MRPIPKRLLIHSATLKVGTKDRWGNPTQTTDVNLTSVRVDPSDKLVQSSTNQEKQLKSILFFDIKNSRPKGATFIKDQIITFEGEDHRIEIIETLYDNKGLHHYELGLI